MALPNGFEGVIVEDGGRVRERVESEEGEEVVEVGVLKETGKFDGVVLWGHEKEVEGDDAYVKGLREWVGFAEKVGFCLAF